MAFEDEIRVGSRVRILSKNTFSNISEVERKFRSIIPAGRSILGSKGLVVEVRENEATVQEDLLRSYYESRGNYGRRDNGNFYLLSDLELL